MQGCDFISIEKIKELGEEIFAVYIYTEYELNKAIAYMKWKGFRTDLLYNLHEYKIFYQSDKFVPDLDDVDEFYKIVNDDNVWSKCDGKLFDYKYRVLSKGVVCISYIPTYAETIEISGKLKKE